MPGRKFWALASAFTIALFLGGCGEPLDGPPGADTPGLTEPVPVPEAPPTLLGCTHTLASGGFAKLDGNQTPVSPGSTICLTAGHMTGLRLENIHGTAANPIVVINSGGQVVIGALPGGASNGFTVSGSSHIKIAGTGEAGFPYGIKLDGTQASALVLAGLSTDIEVEFVEVTNAGFAGIMAKTDPRCDGSANRGNFTQYNTVIHDNYIHDVDGEGLYIGNSFYAGWDDNPSCLGTVLYPHELVGVRIYRNRIENTGADGLQVGCAVQDVEVHHNTVEGYGQDPFASHQDNGIQIGAGTTGRWYDNKVHRGPGNALIIIGLGNISVFNNELVDTQGIYIHKDASPGAEVAIQNNTFIGTKVRGISTPNQVARIKVHNNIMATLPGVVPIRRENSGVVLTDSNNLFDTMDNLGRFGFVDAAGGDYHLTASSPARNAGLDASAYFTFDFDDQPRSDGTFDIGADEHSSSGGLVFSQDFASSSNVGGYVDASQPGTSKFNHIGGDVAGGTWSINAGRLQLVRTGSTVDADNDAGLTRSTDFAGPPSVLHVSFELGASGWTASPYQSNAFCLDLGNFTSTFDYGGAGPAGNVFNALCVTGKGPGKFAWVTGGVQSTSLDADGTLYRVSYFLNKSGASTTYRGPDGSTKTLQANGVSVWVGTALLLNDVAASNGSTSALTDLRLRWGSPDNATWQLDSFVIRNALPQ